MQIDDILFDLTNKYGDDFNWMSIPLSNVSFVEGLKRELGKEHPLYNKIIRAVAKCESNDDVLLFVANETEKEMYYLFHLTYSTQQAQGSARGIEFRTTEEVKEYMEQRYIEEYL